MKTKSTSEKYYEFLQTLSKRQRGFSSMGKMASQAGLCSLIGTFIKKDGLVEKKDGVYKWVGGVPSMRTADKLVKNINDKLMEYYKPSKKSSDNTHACVTKTNRPYAKRPTKRSSDILDLASLRQERMDIMNRVGKIDAVLEVAAGM